MMILLKPFGIQYLIFIFCVIKANSCATLFSEFNMIYIACIKTNIVYNYYFIVIEVQSTPLNRVTLVPEHFDPIKWNLAVGPIKRSELILFLWFCSWPSDPIKRSQLYVL